MGGSLRKQKDYKQSIAGDGMAVGVPVRGKNPNIQIDPKAKISGRVTPDELGRHVMSRGEKAQATALAKLKENNKLTVDRIIREIDQLASKGIRFHRLEIKNYEPAVNFNEIKMILESEKFHVVMQPNGKWCLFEISF